MVSLNEASGSCRRFKVCEGNLALLCEKLAADPESYADEFGEQFEHFQRLLKLLELQPVLHSSSVDTVLQLCNFLSSTALHYPAKAPLLGMLVMRTLSGTRAIQLESELRCALCKCVVRLTLARAVDLHKAVALFFELLRCADKQLRKFVLGALIAFIRRCSKKSTKKAGPKRRPKHKAFAQQLNAQKLQQTLFTMLNDERAVCARVAQLALVEAYRRQWWRNAKTANALAECVFHRVQRIQRFLFFSYTFVFTLWVSTMRFFLGSARDEERTDGQSSSDDEEKAEGSKQEARTLKEVLQQFRHAKKTRKRKKHLEQAKKVIGAQRKKEQRPKEYKQCNVEAIRVIYDPQRFADRLFAALEGRRRNEKYAIRLLQIALCARVIGVHRLQTLGFYSHLHRYLQPKQKEVTRILLYAAQACHSLVPPDVVEQLVRVVAQNFVSDRNTPEAVTVGLNTIREIYANCPAAASEEMVRDLAEYKKMNNKNVSMAARALITLFRTTNPKLLHHKDRGRPTADEISAGDAGGGFGQIKAFDHVPGAEILPEDAEEAERMAQLVNSSDDDEDDAEEEQSNVNYNGRDEEETIAEDEEEVEKNMGQLGEDEDDECGPDSSEDGDDDEEMEDDDEEQIGGEMEDDEEQIGGEMEDDEGQIGGVVEPKEDGGATKVTRAMKGAQKQQKKSAKKKQALLDRLESVARAQQISSSRILGDADFRLIRIRQLRRQARLERGGAKRLTNDEARLDEQIQEKFARTELGDGLPRLGDIEHFHRKIRRQSKAERMEQVKEGRPGKEAYGKPKKGPHVGRTNREMAKRKPAQMIRQKVRGRNRQRSFRDRQKTLRTYLLRQQGKKL